MSRIGSSGSIGVNQLRALNRLTELSKAISENTLRLSTLKRINSSKDDPSGSIQASLLQQELIATEQGIQNIARANAILKTADSAAGEIVSQLQKARSLTQEAAGGTLSDAEISANQIEIDSILRSINMTAKTEFGGRQILNGGSGYRTNSVDTSSFLDIDVLDKQTADDVAIAITIDSTATVATSNYTSGALGSDTTVIITGQDGSAAISLSSGATTQDITDAVNAVSYATGVTAARVSGTDVDFTTVDYGSAASVNIEVTTGDTNLDTGGDITGTDATATINGTTVTGDGSTFSYHSNDVSLVLEIDPTASGALTSFTVSGEGLEFVIGSSATSSARIGLPNLTTTSLGGISGRLSSIGSGEATDLSTDASGALRIIDDALSDATRSRAIIGGFQKFTLDSADKVLQGKQENLTAALSSVQDVDISVETAKLANNQLRQSATLQALMVINLQNQSVLSLLSQATRF